MKRTIKVSAFIALTLTTFALCLGGCQSVYYGTMEKLGYQKREILIDRVEDARNAQEEAKNQFRSCRWRNSLLW